MIFYGRKNINGSLTVKTCERYKAKEFSYTVCTAYSSHYSTINDVSTKHE